MARLKELDRGALKLSGTNARIEVQQRMDTIAKQVTLMRGEVATHEGAIANLRAGIGEHERLRLSYECLLNPGGNLALKGKFTISETDGLIASDGGAAGIDTSRTTGTNRGIRVTGNE